MEFCLIDRTSSPQLRLRGARQPAPLPAAGSGRCAVGARRPPACAPTGDSRYRSAVEARRAPQPAPLPAAAAAVQSERGAPQPAPLPAAGSGRCAVGARRPPACAPTGDSRYRSAVEARRAPQPAPLPAAAATAAQSKHAAPLSLRPCRRQPPRCGRSAAPLSLRPCRRQPPRCGRSAAPVKRRRRPRRALSS